MKEVPNYLKQFSTDEKSKEKSISFALKCDCGCEVFSVAKNSYSRAEKQKIKTYEEKLPDTGYRKVHTDFDEDGRPRIYVKKFFFFKKYFEIPVAPYFLNIKVAKAICENCKREILLYDSRIHSLLSLSANDEQMAYEPHFEEGKEKVGNVFLTFEQEPRESSDQTFSKKKKEPEEKEVYDDSTYFSKIQIHVKTGEQKRKFFDASML